MTAPSGVFVGLATLDVVQLVARPPARNEKTTAEQTWLAAGGPAAVAAIAFAALGGRAQLWTSLGDPPAARVVAADLASAGGEVRDAAPPGFELAASVVLLDAASGERTVVSGSGHTPVFGTVVAPGLAGVDVVLLDGHHPALARAVVSALSLAGGPREVPRVPVVLDAGSHKPVFDELFGGVTDVICSADYVHPSLAPRELLGLGRGRGAASHGGAPRGWWTPGSRGSVSPEPVEAVDTVGAGDVLHGAYCHALASGLDGPDALRRATDVASERVRHLGPFAWRAAIA